MKTAVKSLEVNDYLEVAAEVAILKDVLALFRGVIPQARIDAPDVLPNEHKMWEWSRALHVIKEIFPHGASVVDIGSAYSLIGPALAYLGYQVTECDTNEVYRERQGIVGRQMVNKMNWMTCGHGSLAALPGPYDVVMSISTLEHVDKVIEQQAWKEMVSILKPGGLLIVTCDASESGGDPTLGIIDCYSMSMLRERVSELKSLGMTTMGEEDYEYHGNTVSWSGKGWYSFASVIMRRGEQ